MICILLGEGMVVALADFLLASFLIGYCKTRTLWRSAFK